MYKMFRGSVYYQQGEWSKDAQGKKIVIPSDNINILGEYKFEDIVALTQEQLAYILAKKIQEEKGYNFPVYIEPNDLSTSFNFFSEVTTERWDNLAKDVEVRR